jgi:uncharacterized protein (DUF433 family)
MPRLSDEELSARIEIKDDAAYIKGTRTPVWIILGELADDMSIEDILYDRPYLHTEDILACLLYAAKQAMPKDKQE